MIIASRSCGIATLPFQKAERFWIIENVLKTDRSGTPFGALMVSAHVSAVRARRPRTDGTGACGPAKAAGFRVERLVRMEPRDLLVARKLN